MRIDSVAETIAGLPVNPSKALKVMLFEWDNRKRSWKNREEQGNEHH
jgi:hypothetical protein